jgi:2-methylisocitrate lyase-like PEP mutase family enzyme
MNGLFARLRIASIVLPRPLPSLPENRRPLLKRLLAEGRLLRAIECHDPLSALLGGSARVDRAGVSIEFDVLWASGFSHATSLGLPDAELSTLERRLDCIADIAAATSKPILADVDTGGDALALGYLCRRLEALGISGAVVEDKTGAKRTSLAVGVAHALEEPAAFVRKLTLAREHLQTKDFLLFARIESLIAGTGLEDALMRAEHYLRASTDGVVIHSKDGSGQEILAFNKGYRNLQSKIGISKPLVCIPTAYHHITGAQLQEAGAALVIHGNHMVRAAFRGMQRAARSILEHDRSLEADEYCAPVSELFDAVGTGS